MARRVVGMTGTANVVLPGGWVLDADDEVVISDAEWEEILDDMDLASRLVDSGFTSDPLTPVPSFRDIQRAARAVEDGTVGGGGDPGGGTGVAWEAVFNFAIASTEWTVPHAQGTKAIHIETFDNSDNPIEGNVLYPDLNTVKVQFYFAQSGYVRAWALT